jgi:hypothetical protein
VRASYAQAGNDALPQDILSLFTVNPSFGNNAASIAFPFNNTAGAARGGRVGNLELTPEFTTEVEFGTDLNFFKDRIIFSGTYYDRRTTDQIVPLTLPFATGFSSFITNAGEVTNKGVELGLTLVPVDAGGFRWTNFTAFTRNRNIVEELAPGVLQQLNGNTGAFFGDPQSIHRPGQPYGLLIGSKAARDPETGKVLINQATGRMIASLTNDIIGNPNPDFTIGFTNTFTYKGLTLQGVIDYRQGGDIYSTTINSLYTRGVTRDTEDREKTVVIDGVYGNVNTQLPILNTDGSTTPNTTGISYNDLYFGTGSFASGAPSEFSVFDGTTIRLREITLGYDFPTKLVEQTKFFRSANISFSGRNLYFITPNLPKHMNFDPETSSYGAGNAQGFDFTNAPSSRRYGVNLRVTF